LPLDIRRSGANRYALCRKSLSDRSLIDDARRVFFLALRADS
jgi:hypothetical protein